jgi:tripartite-type tricarboxylate transporter receptor subunit TctC
MGLHRRGVLRLVGGASLSPILARTALAASYPTKPVRLLVGYAAGGPLDITARLMAEWLSQRLGQPFIVENRPGGGTNLATEAVVRAPADGYTLLQISASNAWNATLYDNLTFNFIRDIVPIAGVRRSGGVLEVNPAFPAKTVAEFISFAKANPGKVTVASAGPGSASHLFGELFKTMAGADLVTVNYHGSGPALPDVISGQVHSMIDVVSSSIEHIRSGALRPLGVTTAARLGVLPDTPPIADVVPGYEAISWDGIGAPAGTPTEVVETLNTAVNAALVDPAFKARLADLGVEPFATSPAELARFIGEFTDKWGQVIRKGGIKAE